MKDVDSWMAHVNMELLWLCHTSKLALSCNLGAQLHHHFDLCGGVELMVLCYTHSEGAFTP